MSEKLEKLFKTALEQASVEPPARVWEGIDFHFVMKQRRRRMYAYSGVAAAILLLFCVGYFIQNQQTNSYLPAPLSVVNQEGHIQNENKILAFTSTPRSIPSITRKDKCDNNHLSSEAITPVQLSTRNTLDGYLESEHPEGDLKNSTLRSNFIPLVNQNALENLKKYREMLEGKKTASPVKTKTNDSKKFSVGGYVSPGYSSGSYNTSSGNTRSAQYDDSQMSGIFNLGGGVTFAMKPGKKISIETGIGYSRMGQKTNDAQVFVPQSGMVAYNNATHAYTPLGSVKNKAKATVSTPENFVVLKTEQDEDGSIEQQFDAIEVPLIFRYQLNNNRVKLSVLGGFGASFLVSNQTYVNYRGTKELMGEAENIRTFNITTNIGFGVEYPISKTINIKLEPGFKYYLQSLSKSVNINFKPYTFTFSTGIGINF